ncbi:helix-turn-helix domain-containing protein [Shouchella hunanensis]|uniref:Helix-turn-helix domain-containing protein n=1 Tax=Shouchella hunanensis TaxID=766894 RepID=A0ABY7VZR1_9BACI|nr:helix-turn-helix domain-containing protein [Shouchella hunanensis]WDF02197.1 helix-turn-helix domain-containing protein [Shouchella hunanensis]
MNEHLKNLRKKNKLTQENVAEQLHVSRQAVAKWESGDTVPDLNHAIALARLFNVRLDDLAGEATEYGIGPKGKHIFGLTTIGERGQIVIPKKARDLFQLQAGDKLLILGDEEQGLALVKNEHFLTFADDIFAAQRNDDE